MRTTLASSRLPWVAGSILVLLLGVLAVLQLHWLRQVAEADRERLEAAAETALSTIAFELDRELSRAWLVFRVRGDLAEPSRRSALAARLDLWRATAPAPELVAELLLVRPTGPDEARAWRLVGDEWIERPGEPPPAPRWLSAAIAASAPAARERGEGGAHRGHRRGRHRPPGSVLRPDLPGLALPLGDASTLYVLFDRTYLANDLLPELVVRHLEPVLGPDAEIELATRGGETLYASHPGAGGGYDWQVPAYALLPPEELLRLAFATGVAGEAAGGEASGPGGFPSGSRRLRREAFVRRPGDPSGWLLSARPAAGSLDAALHRAHRGNAALAFGILLLLALAAAALVVSARRARELARRQLELTAGVSHELRTPIAAIRSLADNLADGLVAEPSGARRYGELIGRQGERLSVMVEQVLALAGAEAGGGERRRVELGELVGEVVGELDRASGEERVAPAIEVELPDRPVVVVGDRAALRRAVENLVGNALRHGAPPVRVRAAAGAAVRGAGRAKEARIEVSDAGSGIDPEERERLFEPFVRGRRAHERQLPGSGLGLHLVRRTAEAHGGRVELSAPAAGGGTTFSLVLPAVRARAAKGAEEEP